jgi:hypothetical protein
MNIIGMRILRKFFIEPPPDAQRKERQGAGEEKGRERGIWDWCMLLSGVHRPPHHLSPILRVLLHLPAAMVIREVGTVGAPPPPPSPTPHLNSLRPQRWISRTASDLEYKN